MASKLKDLQVTKVDFVDAGANPEANIVLFKRKPEAAEDQTKPQTESGGFFRSIVAAIAKSIGATSEQVDAAVEEIAKGGDATTFDEKMVERQLRRTCDEIWDYCYVYVGRYHSCSTYKSTTGQSPLVSITRATARSGIKALGTGFSQWDMAMRVTIQMLYLVEFADWNSQTKIGYGCGNGSARQAVGASDSMPYHTGTMQTSRTTYGVGVQYRYIEGLWDNVYDWLDGCYYGSSGLYIIKNPANFSDSANGTAVGTPTGGRPTAMGVATVSGLEWVIYPTAASGGSTTTYVPDIWGFNASYPCLFVGGDCSQYLDYGLFYVNCSSASLSYGSIGCRLQKLP